MEGRDFHTGKRIEPASVFPCCSEDGKSGIGCDEDVDEVSSSAVQQRQDQKQVSSKDIIQTCHSPFAFSRSLSLFLSLSFSSPCSAVISLSAFPMPLFIEQVVLLRLSMKLCVCEPAKHSKSHSCVRHSSYTLLSDNSEATRESSSAAVFSTIHK